MEKLKILKAKDPVLPGTNAKDAELGLGQIVQEEQAEQEEQEFRGAGASGGVWADTEEVEKEIALPVGEQPPAEKSEEGQPHPDSHMDKDFDIPEELLDFSRLDKALSQPLRNMFAASPVESVKRTVLPDNEAEDSEVKAWDSEVWGQDDCEPLYTTRPS